jgi:hypothetical protein
MEDEMPEMDKFEEWWVTPQAWCNVKEMCRTAFWAGHNARGLVAEQLAEADRAGRLEAERDMLLERLELAPSLDVAFLDYQAWREQNRVPLVAQQETP